MPSSELILLPELLSLILRDCTWYGFTTDFALGILNLMVQLTAPLDGFGGSLGPRLSSRREPGTESLHVLAGQKMLRS